MSSGNTYIIGAGVTGLAAGYATGFKVFETKDSPGGISASYYLRPGSSRRLRRSPKDKEAYRFEIGGGHWIFGADDDLLRFMGKFELFNKYERKSAVYFSKSKLCIPYPLQNNLRFIDKKIIDKVLKELSETIEINNATMREWLKTNFGPTLFKLFFSPFHKAYTAGLYGRIAPQDGYKSPVNLKHIIKGANKDICSIGYNASFVYPKNGLDVMLRRMAACCQISYQKRVVNIDIQKKELFFEDGGSISYKKLISTLPLNKVLQMTGLKIDIPADPHTSVLVLNIGAIRGGLFPEEHWLYVPDSKSGFYRVGFYSNVDTSFLPKSFQNNSSRASIYVEKAYLEGEKPSEKEIKGYSESVVEELRQLNFIKKVEVIDATWIDVAYTWVWPGSAWRKQAIRKLEQYDIYQIGRYGRWVFQGIADSIREGMYYNNVPRARFT